MTGQNTVRHVFGRYDRIMLSGAAYRPVRKEKGVHLFQLMVDDVADDTIFITKSDEQISQLLHEKKLRVDYAYYSKALATLRMRQDTSDLNSLSEEDLQTVAWRKQWCVTFLQARRNPDPAERPSVTVKGLETFIEKNKDSIHRWYIDQYKQPRPLGRIIKGRQQKLFDYPGPTTLRNWLSTYQAGYCRADAFKPKYHRCAVLGDADAEELLRYSPKPATRDRFHVVAGETLGHRGVNRTYFRFCPHCVLEDIQAFEGPTAARPWLRLEWTIAHFRSCDEHGVLLTATTPIRRRFEPFNFSEAMGALLDNMQAMADSAPPHPAPSPFQGWLRSRLDGTPDPENWLNKAPLYAAAEFCEALGISALHHPKVKVESLSESDWATAADEGYRIASAGEASLRELLGRLNDAQAATRGVWGPRDTYGYAYGLLQRTRDDPAYETFRDVVRRFAMETMPIPAGTDVLGHVLEKQLVHTVRTAAMTSGAHDRTIRRAFERNGLGKESLNAGLRNHRVTVPAEQIERMLKQLKTSMSTPKVIKATGIPRTHLNALVVGRYLPTVTGSEGQPDAKHRFAQSEIQAMLARLFKGAVEVETPTPRQMSIANTRHAAVTSLGNLFEMIFEGHLTWKGHLQGRRDYGALLLDVDEVARLVRSGPAMTNLSRTEAIAAIPGFNRFALDAFLATRHLKTAMEFNPEARRMVEVITKDSVELFRGNFITLGELRELSGGLHLKRVKLLLKGAGIQPAFDPDDFKVWIYDRHAVDRVLAERPDFWVYDKAKALAAAH